MGQILKCHWWLRCGLCTTCWPLCHVHIECRIQYSGYLYLCYFISTNFIAEVSIVFSLIPFHSIFAFNWRYGRNSIFCQRTRSKIRSGARYFIYKPKADCSRPGETSWDKALEIMKGLAKASAETCPSVTLSVLIHRRSLKPVTFILHTSHWGRLIKNHHTGTNKW
jgi:hypothetical protein